MTEEALTVVEFDEDIATAEQPDPLPVGDYPFEIRGAEIKVSGSGNRYAAVTCYISPDDFPADFDVNNAPDGVTIVYRRVLMENTPQSRFRLRQFCEAIGAPMSTRMDVSDWIGLRGIAIVDHSEYEGVVRPEITRIKPE